MFGWRHYRLSIGLSLGVVAVCVSVPPLHAEDTPRHKEQRNRMVDKEIVREG